MIPFLVNTIAVTLTLMGVWDLRHGVIIAVISGGIVLIISKFRISETIILRIIKPEIQLDLSDYQNRIFCLSVLVLDLALKFGALVLAVVTWVAEWIVAIPFWITSAGWLDFDEESLLRLWFSRHIAKYLLKPALLVMKFTGWVDLIIEKILQFEKEYLYDII